MANDKIKVKTAKSELNRFPMSFSHGTTDKFFHPSVPFIMEIIEGSSANIKMSAMRRIDPMPLPPMSMVRFNTRFYFVPYIDICPYYYELISQTPYQFRYGLDSGNNTSAIPTSVPTLTTKVILSLLFSGFKISETVSEEPGMSYTAIEDANSNKLTTLQDQSTGTHPSNDYLYIERIAYENTYSSVFGNIKYDIRIPFYGDDNNDGQIIIRFTERGRSFFKLLKQLGYDFTCQGVEFDCTSDGKASVNITSHNNITFSALPLLAYLKVMLNYYENSAFINNTTRLKQMGSLCHIDVDAYNLSESDIDIIADQTMVMSYPRDYFTTNFINPLAGNNFGVNSESITIDDPTVNALTPSGVTTNNNNEHTPTLKAGLNTGVISDTGIKLLRRLTNFMRRHQISGGRVVDRVLAEYGVSLNDSFTRRTSYIDTISSVMNITPVLNTTSDKLGDYAGFGVSAVDGRGNNNSINVKTKENGGFIIAIDTIVPEIFYSQGYNRMCRHISKFDFLTHDFDAVSVQGTEVGELYMTKQGIYPYVNNGNPSTLRFGNKPRYSEYKEMVSRLTGDFIVDSVNTDIDGYFTDRRFKLDNYLDENDEIDLHFSRSFCTTYENEQFSRIFYTNNRRTDYIKSIYRFEVELISPMKPLYDEFKLDDVYGNDEVTTTVGGQTMV